MSESGREIKPACSGAGETLLCITKIPQITRQRLADPYTDVPFRERLIKAGAVDLTNNYNIKDLGNGYSRVMPIDRTKLIK